jgi:hypothetical protein
MDDRSSLVRVFLDSSGARRAYYIPIWPRSWDDVKEQH